jgi:8-oxo-(d)GTP phosphatase
MLFYTHEIPIEIRDARLKDAQEGAYVVGSASGKQVWDYFQQIRDKRVIGKTHLVLLTTQYEKTVKDFLANFELVQAAGGFVISKNRLLAIQRLGKWDLPKGKIERGEDTKTAALREVEEECGIRATAGEKIGETWHTYNQRGKDYIKCTHWYLMDSTDDRTPVPQTEEAITLAEWIPLEKVQEVVINNTYKSIADALIVFMKSRK